MDRDEVNLPQQEEAPGSDNEDVDLPMTQGLSVFKALNLWQKKTCLKDVSEMPRMPATKGR